MGEVARLPIRGGWLDEYDVPPRSVAVAVLDGLKAAGVKAEQGKIWRGRSSISLDLVIDLPCPFSHVSQDRTSFAKVRLLVDPHRGTLTVQRDEDRGEGCPRCDQTAIDRWLWTCRGHHENGHLDHEPGWIGVGDFPDDVPHEEIARVLGDNYDGAVTDNSPIGFVLAAMMKAEREVKARWRLAHLDQIADGFRLSGYSEEQVREKVASVREMAKAELSGSTEVMMEDKPSAQHVAEWLAEQGVPATLGVNATWQRVKSVPGCPSQALVREAQKKRRG